MPTSPEQSLEAWINSRKETPAAHLTQGVMREIQSESEPVFQPSSKPKPPSWLVASACLLAGIGKLGLIYHLAF